MLAHSGLYSMASSPLKRASACLTFLRRISAGHNESDRDRDDKFREWVEEIKQSNVLVDFDFHLCIVEDGYPVEKGRSAKCVKNCMAFHKSKALDRCWESLNHTSQVQSDSPSTTIWYSYESNVFRIMSTLPGKRIAKKIMDCAHPEFHPQRLMQEEFKWIRRAYRWPPPPMP